MEKFVVRHETKWSAAKTPLRLLLQTFLHYEWGLDKTLESCRVCGGLGCSPPRGPKGSAGRMREAVEGGREPRTGREPEEKGHVGGPRRQDDAIGGSCDLWAERLHHAGDGRGVVRVKTDETGAGVNGRRHHPSGQRKQARESFLRFLLH